MTLQQPTSNTNEYIVQNASTGLYIHELSN